MDPDNVVKGRLTELRHMNDHHVYDWIDEADIPTGTRIETSRWCDDLKPRDGDETNVRSRVVVQQSNVVKRDEHHQGTPPAEGAEDVACVGHEPRRTPPEGVWNLGRQRGVLSFSDG